MDERLRHLERAARARPDDLAVGRALVRARDQAGDVVGAWQARCRLARAGDEAAWAELTRLPEGALEVGEPVERVIESRADVDADASTVVVAGASSLEALDAATFEPRWSVAGAQDLARLAGPFVAHVPARTRELVLRDARDGALVARTALPGDAVRAAVTLDRLIVTCERELSATSLVVDLGDEPGAPLAARADVPPFRAAVLAGRGLRLVYEMAGIADAVEARDADTDAVAWRSREALRHASDLGFVVVTRAQPRRMLELEPTTGATRWEAPLDLPQGGVGALLTPELAIVSTQVPPWRDDARRFNVAAFDRATGARRWIGGDAEDDVRWTFVGQACAATCAYFVRSPDEGPAIDERHVEARDLRTGALAWSRPLGFRRGDPVEVHAVDGGLVVARIHDGRTTLVRLGRR